MADIKINKIIAEPDNQVTRKKVYEHLADLDAQFIALLQKLDADGGVTDADYESTLTPTDVFVK